MTTKQKMGQTHVIKAGGEKLKNDITPPQLNFTHQDLGVCLL